MAASEKVVMAIGAHPDDIEFMMGGTLFALRAAGYKVHYMNIARGDLGSVDRTREEIAEIRLEEARAAAALLDAEHHLPVASDFEVFYDMDTLKQVGGAMRIAAPDIVLCPSPEDYMEDHQNASRLAVSGAFGLGIRNFHTKPWMEPVMKDVTVYHALPYGLRDGMRRRIFAGQYVDVTDVLERKREMLAQHKSQKEWLDKSQGLDAYLETMEAMSAEVGKMSERFQYAEGWRRHSHLGFSAGEVDPLTDALRDRTRIDESYEAGLERGQLSR